MVKKKRKNAPAEMFCHPGKQHAGSIFYRPCTFYLLPLPLPRPLTFLSIWAIAINSLPNHSFRVVPSLLQRRLNHIPQPHDASLRNLTALRRALQALADF